MGAVLAVLVAVGARRRGPWACHGPLRAVGWGRGARRHGQRCSPAAAPSTRPPRSVRGSWARSSPAPSAGTSGSRWARRGAAPSSSPSPAPCRPGRAYAVAVTASLGAVAAAETDRRWQHEAIGPVLLLVAAVGVFCAVPDTEESGALMGAAVAAAGLGWPLRIARLGGGWAAAVVALSAWAVAVGGRGRPLSVLGGLACLGLLVAWPMGRRIARDLRLPSRAAVPGLVIGAQLGVVAVASRVAGTSFDPAVAVPAAAASGVAAVAAARSSVRPAEDPSGTSRPCAGAPPPGPPARSRGRGPPAGSDRPGSPGRLPPGAARGGAPRGDRGSTR